MRPWKIRVVVYGCLALLAVPAVAARVNAEEEPVVLLGETDQGERFRLVLNEGRPTFLSTRVSAWCPAAGEAFTTGWSPADGRPEPYRFEDGRLMVREHARPRYPRGVSGDLRLALRGRVDEERASGTIDFRATFTAEGAGPTVCRRAGLSWKATKP